MGLLRIPTAISMSKIVLVLFAAVLLLFSYLLGSHLVTASAPTCTLHTLHVQEQSLTCDDCHAPQLAIKRETCQNCHDAPEVAKLLQTFTAEVASGALPAPPADHTQDFRRAHGLKAGVDPLRCSKCHRQSFCQDCHEGENLQGTIHPLNFRQTHGFEALGQVQDCLVCHENREFCTDCHRQSGVINHPLGTGWANPSEGGAHTEEAEANLESCLDCHDLGRDDPVCTRPGCHDSAGGSDE